MPDTVRRTDRDPTRTLLLLAAYSSLAMGLFGASIMLRMKVRTPKQVQPHVATEIELADEKGLQRRKIAELINQIAEPLRDVPAVAAVAPPDARQDHKPSAPRPKQKPKARPDKSKTPQTPGSEPPTAREAFIFLTYLADQIATLHIESRNVSSRVAATESMLRQLQDSKGWYDWFALCVTLMGIIQGLLGIAIALRKTAPHKAVPDAI